MRNGQTFDLFSNLVQVDHFKVAGATRLVNVTQLQVAQLFNRFGSTALLPVGGTREASPRGGVATGSESGYEQTYSTEHANANKASKTQWRVRFGLAFSPVARPQKP